MGIIKQLLHNRDMQQKLEQRRDKMFRVACSWCHDSHLADDLVQQALVKALQNLGSLRSIEVLDAWLYRILSNCWKDYLRSQRENIDIDHAGLVGESSLEDSHHQGQIVDRVRQAIRALPDAQRQVITLVDLAGLTYKEVSEVLEVPIGTVMSRVCRARQSLRTSLVEFQQVDNKTEPRLRNSYLDNELDAEDRDALLNALENDATLSRRLCELRNIKELTQHAYRMESGRANSRSHWLARTIPATAVASVLMVVTGVLIGWFAHSGMEHTMTMAGMNAGTSLDSVALADQKKIILHVDTAEPEKFNAALDSAESLLAAYSEQNHSLQMEIIANAEGLDFLRVGMTENQTRIKDLVGKYDNLSIVACNKAIERLEEMGIKVELIPEAGIAPSALEEIVKRLQQGWVYIKV
jgi:RNA polymerase sigma-70 factor (ECF subfamily)